MGPNDRLPGFSEEERERMKEIENKGKETIRKYAQEHGITEEEAAERILSESELRIRPDRLMPF